MPLQVVRLTDAVPFSPPGHLNVQPFQLQGDAQAPTEDITVVLSHYLPGGRAESQAMTAETVYVVVAGELVVSCEGEEITLGVFDSVLLPPGAVRVMENRSPLPASMIVVRSTRTSN